MAQFRFQQEWFDDRLRFTEHSDFRNFDFIHVARDQLLWTPDTFFQNERNGWYHMLDQVSDCFFHRLGYQSFR